MNVLKYVVLLSIFLHAECEVPSQIRGLVQESSIADLRKYSDVKRNYNALKKLCTYQISFKEGKYDWDMLLVTHPTHSKGIFWYLPHDDENEAFDAAVYATQKYGGGFLSVRAENKRFFKDQDPNRNFGEDAATAKQCKEQKAPAPLYSKNVFKVIDAFRHPALPYLSLHNNKNGWYGNGGAGGVSILKSSKIVQSYPAKKPVKKNDKGLADEDSLVFIAGKENKPDQQKLNQLLQQKMHTKYEVISKTKNDCSLSNYIVLEKGTTDYYNLETEHGDLNTQKEMIDRLVEILIK